MSDPFVIDGKRRQATRKQADPEAVPRAVERVADPALSPKPAASAGRRAEPVQRSAASTAQPSTPAQQRLTARKVSPRHQTDTRVMRTLRLTAALDHKLRDLSELRGIDLTAAVSVAIAEDWLRTCHHRVP